MKNLIKIILAAGMFMSCKTKPAWEKYPYDSQAHMEEFTLQKLEKEYGIKFQYCAEYNGPPVSNEYELYDPAAKNEKTAPAGWVKWARKNYMRSIFSGLVEPVAEAGKPDHPYCKYNVSLDSKGVHRDGAHAFFFRDRITEKLNEILSTVKFEKKPEIHISGLERPMGKWTGKEKFETYIRARDFESWIYVYLADGKTNAEYAKEIYGILQLLSSDAAQPYNISVEVRKDDNTVDENENRPGSILFIQDLDQEGMIPGYWTEENVLEDLGMHSPENSN
jgi:hypothetical protein